MVRLRRVTLWWRGAHCFRLVTWRGVLWAHRRVVPRWMVFGRVSSHGCVVALWYSVCCVVSCGVEWCHVVPGVGCGISRGVLFCGGWLCGVVLCHVAWCGVAFVWLVGSSGYVICHVAVLPCVSLCGSVVLRVSWCPVLCVVLGLALCWVLSRFVMCCGGVSCGVPLWCVALWFVALCCFVVVDPGGF